MLAGRGLPHLDQGQREVVAPHVALRDGVDLVGDQPVRLAVDRVGGLGVGRLDEAEDLARGLVDPVAQVAHAVGALRREVGLVRAATSVAETPPSIVCASMNSAMSSVLSLPGSTRFVGPDTQDTKAACDAVCDEE